ncbi:helicase-related protein [Bacillus cereus]|nr:helicase-related protein [Bacillus cereus]
MSEIPEIIDNRHVLLKDTINQLIRHATEVEIATGYFYLNGFNLIKEHIGPNCIIKILIGNETDAITVNELSMGYDLKKKAVMNSMESDLNYLNDEQTQQVNDLAELIKEGKINVRIYVKEKFHSKAYIFDVSYNNGEIKENYAIVGSSNFSKRGLGDKDNDKTNTELNALLRQPSAVKEVKKWYSEVWEEAEDFNEDLLKIIENNLNIERLTYSPFDILIKTLFEYLKDDSLFEEVKSLNLDDLTKFQAFAVKKAIQILSKYNGVIIADSVGLGKTYVAKGLLRYFSQFGKNILIICPSSLKPMWESEAANSPTLIKIITQESIGRDGISTEVADNIDTIIIDEAHNFRNETANRHRELVKITMGKKVIQLTATPVNNSIFDLYNILTLFLKDDDFKNKYGIAKLRDIFNYYEEKKDEVSNILNEIMIRRSRTFIKSKYGDSDNKLFIKGNELKFPKRNLKKIGYSISELYGENIFVEISTIIEKLNLPIISEESLTEQQEVYNKALVKTMFLKRFESSVEAFRISIYKQIRFCEILLSSIEKGYLVTKKDVMEDIESDSFDIIDSIEKIDIEQFEGSIELLKRQILDDLESFKRIVDLIKDINDEADVKLQELLYQIKNLKNKKVLIFTQFKDTARYLYKHVIDNNFGVVAEIDSKNNKNNRKEKIVAQFSPKANPDHYDPEKPEIDILISTDILSEGQNLQDCNIIINYDLTWNPVRIIQREGRIDRITTSHDKIYIYNFIPDDKLDEILKLTKRLAEKITYINETIGNESRIISNDEILIDKVFNEKDQARIKRLNEEDQSLLDELERERDDIIPSEEYIYEDYKDIIFSNKNNQLYASQLPDKIYSIRKLENYQGLYMYYKLGKESYWLFYDVNTKKIKTSKAEIYQLIAQGNYLNSKPIKRHISFNVDEILELGKKYVENQVANIIQVQMTSAELDKVQKDIAERLEKIFSKTKYRSRITREQRMIRKKLKNPLHKGTISKLKTIDLKLPDDELVNKIDEMLEYINVEEKLEYKNDPRDIKLICYEVFV